MLHLALQVNVLSALYVASLILIRKLTIKQHKIQIMVRWRAQNDISQKVEVDFAFAVERMTSGGSLAGHDWDTWTW